MGEALTEKELQEAGSIKYRGITTVALSSGRLCVLGHFSNIDGLPVIQAFWLHEANEMFTLIKRLQEEEPKPSFRSVSNERLGKSRTRSTIDVSLDDLGL